MVKFTAQLADGMVLVGIGLTDKNVQLITQNNPIKFCLADVGIGPLTPGSQIVLFIFHGKDEDAIADQLRSYGLVDGRTEVVEKRGS